MDLPDIGILHGPPLIRGIQVDPSLLLRAKQRIRDGRMNGGGDFARGLADALRDTFGRGDVRAAPGPAYGTRF